MPEVLKCGSDYITGFTDIWLSETENPGYAHSYPRTYSRVSLIFLSETGPCSGMCVCWGVCVSLSAVFMSVLLWLSVTLMQWACVCLSAHVYKVKLR